jgi:Family of unknown function (DUF6152)
MKHYTRVAQVMVIAALFVSLPASAHHSGAMFDSKKEQTLAGTVREFQWSNPHCWIQLLVRASDNTEEWSVEMGAPLELFKAGWKRGTLKAGDRITVVVHPNKDGSRSGSFLSAIGADGTVLAAHP